MKQPRVLDDGTTVELDLHGSNVEDAIAFVRRAAMIASERGRSTIRVIHGSSTSHDVERNRTIKHALQDALADGIPYVSSHHGMDDVTLLSLDRGPRSRPEQITLFDLR